MKKSLKIFISSLVLLGLVFSIMPLFVVNSNAAIPAYVSSGLVSLYDGNGQEELSTTWKDRVGSNDFTVLANSKNMLTKGGYVLEATKAKLPQNIVDLINGSAFTVEMYFGPFTSIGGSFNTFLNSSNDNIALFRRNNTNEIEVKHAGCSGTQRPKVSDALNSLKNSLVSVTFNKSGNIKVYINGVEKASMPAVGTMNADDLFIGHDEASRQFSTIYRSIRFYNRELSSSEVSANYNVDKALYYNYVDVLPKAPEYTPGTLSSAAKTYVGKYVSSGLKSFFSGTYNKRSGHDANATRWEDLVGNGYLDVSKNTTNYFTSDSYKLNGTRATFGNDVLNIVNGQTFTVEILFGSFKSTGTTYNTFMNSSNDKFALFRRNASDVIEFKFYGNTTDARIIVPEAIDTLPNSLITITAKVGGSVKMYINGHLAATMPYKQTMGADNLFIGHDSLDKSFNADYKSVRFYNRELTAAEVETNAKADNVFNNTTVIASGVTVAQPVTKVVGDIGAVREIDSANELSAAISAAKKPAAVILKINSKLEVVNSQGSKITTVSDALAKLDKKILAAFSVSDESTVNALGDYLSTHKFFDCFFMSKNENLILKARTAYPRVMGIIDYTAKYGGKNGLSQAECTAVRKSMHKNMGTIALLPESAATKETIQTLYEGIVNVWLRGKDNPTKTELYKYILSGAIGVVTDNTDVLLDIACNEIPTGTMTRMPLNVGHRGIPSKAPENTIEGYLAAIKNGANVVETDIYVTSDNQLVVMHNPTTGATCNKDLAVESSTLAQLQALYANKTWEGNATYNKCKIPSFEELLKAVKGTGCKIFVEIKSGKANCVPLMKALIDKYDMYDQISVITFLSDQIANMRKYYPEMSVGFLTSGILDETNSDADMLQVMKAIGEYNTTLNPSSPGYGANAIRAALIRGVGVYPWTFTTSVEYGKYFTLGYSGLTGNNADVQGAYVKEISYTESNGTFTVKSTTYAGVVKDISSSVTFKFIDGENNATVSGNKVTLKNDSSATFIIEYKGLASGKAYMLCSEPVTLVNGTPAVTEAPTSSIDPLATVDPNATHDPDATEDPAASNEPDETASNPDESAMPGDATQNPSETSAPDNTKEPGGEIDNKGINKMVLFIVIGAILLAAASAGVIIFVAKKKHEK